MLDVYKIGVHMAFSSNGMGVLGLLSGEMSKLGKMTETTVGKFSALRVAAVGAMAAIGGGLALKGLWEMTKQAEKLNHELVKIKIGASLSDADVGGVRTDAYRMTQAVPGTTVDENVKVQRELFGTFGDMKEVHETIKGVLTANQALSRYGNSDTDVAQVAIRALEMRGHIGKDGKIDPGEFNKELDALTRSIIASEGLLKPNDYLQAIRQAGPAATSMDAEAFWGMMPAAMVAMGSAKAGTALSSLFQQVVGHVIAGKRIAIAMQDAGMLKPHSWRVERGGHVVMDKDAVVNQDKFAHDPFTYIHEMMERLKGQKDKHGKPVDMVGIIQTIFQLSSRVTSARLINDVSQNWPIFQNEQNRFKRAGGADAAAKEQNEHDLSANIGNLNAAWHNFMTALGEPGIPIAIDILHRLTTTLTEWSLWASQHGDLVGNIEKISGALAGMAVVIGGAMMATALATLLTLPAGLLGLAAGIEALGKAFPSIPSWMVHAASGAAVGAAVGSVVPGVGTGVGAVVGAVAGAVGSAVVNTPSMKPPGPRDPARKALGDYGHMMDPSSRPAADPNIHRESYEPNNRPTVDPNIHRESYVPAGSDMRPIQVHTEIKLDGRTLGRAVTDHQADRASRQQRGPTGYDPTMTPAFPSNWVPA
jgi:TP901 family phage tail tape measure protein